jgi:hypothetical protein
MPQEILSDTQFADRQRPPQRPKATRSRVSTIRMWSSRWNQVLETCIGFGAGIFDVLDGVANLAGEVLYDARGRGAKVSVGSVTRSRSGK